jgi:hypothetical protein
VKVLVRPEVERGANRGGEDLYLVIVAEFEGETPPTADEPLEVAFVVDEDELDGCSLSLPEDVDPEELYGGPIEYRTNMYEFAFKGDAGDVLGLEAYTLKEDGSHGSYGPATVGAAIRNPLEWKFCHRHGESPRLRCEIRSFVDGNAD